MHVIITGGRTYELTRDDYDWLDTLGITHVRQGGAQGADLGARRWAALRGIPCQTYEADWTRGRSGGPRRNEAMLRDLVVDMAVGIPAVVLAFPGGTGTEDMTRRALGKEVAVVYRRKHAPPRTLAGRADA